ncbi:TPA: hypothetical protein NI771_003272 [Pseudomonas aeruginosa]|nr:hypothetical protein [Pseudomonas aeruginosa]HCF9556206.1 hypothetical protein [Pseudomonas aeruginosa]HCF9576035.1 hypothetical protein [Pseudomonas aeruginosa]HCF9589132.1 hypothetical protein [Pseudomonas aeruginosa]HCF9603064.1 hypothetical protein [Pseudomonas aeruginosa]
MTSQPKPGRIITGPNGRPVIAGPWPSYRQFRDLCESDRLLMYRHAKPWASLEVQGFEMAEDYDAFVRRVTEELDI